MRKRALVIAAVILLLASSPMLLRKRRVQLVSNGRNVAIATVPSNLIPGDKEYCVYAGKKKLFGVWGDLWDFPLLILPLPDGEQFLCVDDDDTATPVFIVDFRSGAASIPSTQGWPPDDYARNVLAGRATNVVMNTTGVIRLPSYAEVQEVSNYVAHLTPRQYRAASIPIRDFGVFRMYAPKHSILADLNTNRHSVW